MANTLLYPITVSAKVVRSATKVPSLGGAAFNRDAALEAGIHLHWALPDALTASQLLSDQGTKTAIFPAVPDLWLVIRFNPGASSATPLAKRTWSAWVVDSIDQIVTPLSQWTPPTKRDATKIHTLAGVLPDAGPQSHSGWGVWDTDPAAGLPQTFDPVMAAYYPESRKRFGFYDSLQGLTPKGNVSYLVVGWYWTDKHDPLTVSTFPSHVIDKWKAVAVTPSSALADISTQVNFAAPAQAPAVWDVNIAAAGAKLPPQAKIDQIKRVATRAGSVALQAKKLETMRASFPAPPPVGAVLTVAQQGTWALASAAVQTQFIARETICHGSIVSVPLAGSSTAPVPITNNNIQLYPNVKRALADIAAKSGDPNQVNAIEMLLADLGSQKFSTGGVIDMAGAAHAATFQSVPGKAKTYARMDIEAPADTTPRASTFTIQPSKELVARQGLGYWPALTTTRSASVVKKSRIAMFPGIPVTHPPVQATPPTADQISAFVASVQAAFQTAVTAAAASGVTLDPRMLRIQDSRTNARSLSLGTTTDNSGSDSAGWWIDIEDTNALGQLLTTTGGATVSLPAAVNTYDIPGPRWYRSWAPQIVLSNIGRSYKFGLDTRFRADNKVLTRVSGTTLVSMTLSKQAAVYGTDLIATPENLNVPGIPSEVTSLVRETLLLDTESAGVMASNGTPPNPTGAPANLAPVQAAYTSAIQGVLLARDSRFNSAVLQAVALDGSQPSAIAITLWQDPFDPLFLDSNYSHPYSKFDDWKLDASDVEMTLQTVDANFPPSDGVLSFTERSMVTATVVNVLKSALVTRSVVDPQGHTTRVQVVDPSLTEDTFTKMDVVSAPLTRFDSQLYAQNFRLRAGALRINSLEVVDMFGFTRPWNSGIAPSAPDGAVAWPYWVALPPRFPYWSRFNFRLTEAADPSTEATPLVGPVCGILLPDFIEHALEVFDGAGNGLGQLATDIPIQGQTAGTTLHVTYTPHPWLDPDPDPFHHITNPTLKSFVQAVVQQELVVPAGNVVWAETGLSAMLRTIDTIRGTFDPTAKVAQRTVSLIGEPILVMGARLQFNGTSTDKTQDLAGDPPLLAAPPDLPTLDVRIGDVTRPDDGVLGLFIAGATPDASHFAPVTREAADKAIVNALSIFVAGGTTPVTHPFVQGQESLVSLPANQPVDVVILSDIRNAIYATCGALPRKKITIPKDFVDSAIKNLEPSFYTGPILTTTQFGVEKALLPPPDVAGYSAEFLYQAPDSTAFQSTEVPAAPPLSDLPKSRVLLTEGWLRMVGVKKPS